MDVLQVTCLCVSLVLIIGYLLHLRISRRYKLWKQLGVPYIEPWPIIGNAMKILLLQKTGAEVVKDTYMENRDKPYVGIFIFDVPKLLITDQELVKAVLMKDMAVFNNRSVTANASVDAIAARSLFLRRDQDWRRSREFLTPAFTPSRMKNYFNMMNMSAVDFVNHLDQLSGNGSPVKMRDSVYRFTTDMLGRCTGSLDLKHMTDLSVTPWYLTFLQMLAVLFIVASRFVHDHLRIPVLSKKMADLARNTLWNFVEEREKEGGSYHDLIQNLMDQRKKKRESDSMELEDDDILSDLLTMLLASYMTVSAALTFALYELALNPEVQSRLRTEILRALEKNNQQVTQECIEDLEYLDMVMNETLRKYPILGIIDRQCNTDYTLPGPDGKGTVVLPAGTGLFISNQGIHSNPEFYPEPEKFDPERFTEENKRTRPDFSFIPFGGGLRSCIGKRFGILQLKTGLFHVVSNFKIAPCKDTPLHATFHPFSVILTNSREIPLTLTKLQNHQQQMRSTDS